MGWFGHNTMHEKFFLTESHFFIRKVKVTRETLLNTTHYGRWTGAAHLSSELAESHVDRREKVAFR